VASFALPLCWPQGRSLQYHLECPEIVLTTSISSSSTTATATDVPYISLDHSMERPEVAGRENDFQTCRVLSQNLLRRTAREKEREK
jgi:hypothetical protein